MTWEEINMTIGRVKGEEKYSLSETEKHKATLALLALLEHGYMPSVGNNKREIYDNTKQRGGI